MQARTMALGWSLGPLAVPGLLFTSTTSLFSTVLASVSKAAHLVPKNAVLDEETAPQTPLLSLRGPCLSLSIT